MLVVSRKLHESIRISSDISVKIIRIDKDTVRIGVEAPREVCVHREEVYQEILQANIEAATTQVTLSGWTPLASSTAEL
jgi:carbon storage regulator